MTTHLHHHGSDGTCIHAVCLGKTQAEALKEKIGVERIQDEGSQTFIQQESEYVVAVMTGGFKSYFYRTGTLDTVTVVT